MKAYLSYVKRPDHLEIGFTKTKESFGEFEVSGVEDVETIKRNLEALGKVCDLSEEPIGLR